VETELGGGDMDMQFDRRPGTAAVGSGGANGSGFEAIDVYAGMVGKSLIDSLGIPGRDVRTPVRARTKDVERFVLESDRSGRQGIDERANGGTGRDGRNRGIELPTGGLDSDQQDDAIGISSPSSASHRLVLERVA